MKTLKIQLILVILGALSVVNITNAGVYIDASGPVPTLTSDDPFVFSGSFCSITAGCSTITPIGPNAWDINFKVAGGDYASFGGSNRGLELLEPGTGKLLDSFSFNYWSRQGGGVDIVTFDAYLYTADAFGNPSGRSARCPQGLCMTTDYNGTYQLAMQNMSTAYTTFNVYLKGTTPAVVPIPAAIWLFGSALAGFIGFNCRKPMNQAV